MAMMTAGNLADRNCQTSEVDRTTAELFARIFRLYKQAPQSVKDVIETMSHIINDKNADPEERAAARDTLWEALFPSGHGDQFGADLGDLATGDHAEVEQRTRVFADAVRHLLKRKGMTQGDLAKAVGVGQPAIAMLLSRECRPQKATVTKIADALGVSPKALWPE